MCKNIGSQWRKWDFHVHTPSSFDYHNKNISSESIVDKFLGLGVEALVITDHNIIDVDRILELKQIANGRIAIFPGIEIRSNLGGSQLVHFTAIFSNDFDKDSLDELERKISVGLSLNHSDLQEKTHKNIFVDIEVFLKIVKECRGLVCVHAGTNRSNSFENIKESLKDEYIKKIDILEVSKIDQINAYREKVFPDINRKLPIVLGSDGHSLTEYEGKRLDKCWVKADLTFEGLKQIIYEPETRVSIGKDKPKEPLNYISTIDIDISSDTKADEYKFCFAGLKEQFLLSPYFNCFIGPRGSGKSTLLNLLGLCSVNKKSPVEFFQSIKLNKSNPEEFISCEAIDFEFLGQSQIESFASNEVGFTDAIYQRAKARDESLNCFEIGIEKNHKQFDSIIQQIKTYKILLSQKESLLREKKMIDDAQKFMGEKSYQEITDRIRTLQVNCKEIEDWKSKVYELRASVSELLEANPIKSEKDEIDVNAYNTAINKIIEANVSLKSYDLDMINSLVNIKKQTIDKLKKERIALLESKDLSPEDLEQIKNAPEKSIKINADLQGFDSKMAMFESSIAAIDTVAEESLQNQLNYEKKITKLIEPLKDQLKSQVINDNAENIKEIDLLYKFDVDTAWEKLSEEFFYFFSNQFAITVRCSDVCKFICEKKENFKGNTYSDIEFLLVSQPKQPQYMLFLQEVFRDENNYKIFKAIRNKHLYDVLQYKIINVKYDGRNIQHASFGQKCTAVLVILFLFGNKPLIIDEPEAHLDSALISNYLVPLLKENKSNRQVIFATHNANFVVNGDAEKIFILSSNKDDGLTKVSETTIEDLQHRNSLLKLEGGKDAFRKRGAKLNI